MGKPAPTQQSRPEVVKAAIDPDLLAAADEVDQTLFESTLPLLPLERLRAATRHLRALSGYRREPPAGR